MGCFISDLSGASVSLSNPSLTNGAFTAATLNGSAAVVSIPASPSLDRTLFRLSVVAKESDDGVYGNGSGTSFTGAFSLGPSFSPTAQFTSVSGVGVGAGTYVFELDGMWDSSTQNLVMQAVLGFSLKVGSGGNSNGNLGGPVVGSSPYRFSNVTVQTGIQFAFGAVWNQTSNPANVILTQFKLSLI